MRPRFAGQTTNPNPRFAPVLMGLTAALAVCLALPAYQALVRKEGARALDRTVSLAVDWDDIRAFVPPENVSSYLLFLRNIPVSVMTVRDGLGTQDEQRLRDNGFVLLWKLRDGADSALFPTRLGPKDGVVVTGEYALESPGMAEALAAVVRRESGFLAVIEFSPVRPLLHLPILLRDHLVRAHVLPTRETVWPKPALWSARLTRAVRERWVRLVCFRFSSSWTGQLNGDFVQQTAVRLREAGFEIGMAVPLRPWAMPFAGASWAALLLACLAPAAVIALVYRTPSRGALVLFTVATAVSAVTGVIVHGLTASPAAVAGVASYRGVKIQLVLPLVLSGLVLLRGSELLSFFKRRVTWGDLCLAGGVLGLGLVAYLMRSGNQPFLSATDGERAFRDLLENVLGARPRFKEFAFGHPLLIAGLFLRGKAQGFFRDGRALILLGAIGQISVVNTFVHAPAPLTESLLRTFHGWWVGALVALPLCHLLNRVMVPEKK